MEQAQQDLITGTKSLGELLEGLSDSDPLGTPTPIAGAAFSSWLADAQLFAPKPEYFDDVRENFDPLVNTNKDLHDLFQILIQHVAIEDDDDDDTLPIRESRTFIGLPLLTPTPNPPR